MSSAAGGREYILYVDTTHYSMALYRMSCSRALSYSVLSQGEPSVPRPALPNAFPYSCTCPLPLRTRVLLTAPMCI